MKAKTYQTIYEIENSDVVFTIPIGRNDYCYFVLGKDLLKRMKPNNSLATHITKKVNKILTIMFIPDKL